MDKAVVEQPEDDLIETSSRVLSNDVLPGARRLGEVRLRKLTETSLSAEGEPPKKKVRSNGRTTVDLNAAKKKLDEQKFIYSGVIAHPEYEECEKQIKVYGQHLKLGIVASILARDCRKILQYLDALLEFVNYYGTRFEKSEHIKLMRILYRLCTEDDHQTHIVMKAVATYDFFFSHTTIDFKYNEVREDWSKLLRLVLNAKEWNEDILKSAFSAIVNKFPEMKQELMDEFAEDDNIEEICRLFGDDDAEECESDTNSSNSSDSVAELPILEEMERILEKFRIRQDRVDLNDVACEVQELLIRASEETSQKWSTKLLDVIAKFEPSSNNSSRGLAAIVAETARFCPESISLLAREVLLKLRVTLTEEVRRTYHMPTLSVHFCNIAASLFETSASALSQFKTIYFEIMELLLDCQDIKGYTAGIRALSTALWKITSCYVCIDNIKNNETNSAVEEVTWHFPDEEEIHLAEEFLHRFVFPLLKNLREPNYDKHHASMAFKLLRSVLRAGKAVFPPPMDSEGTPRSSILPLPSAVLKGLPKYRRVISIDGKNVIHEIFHLCKFYLEEVVRSDSGYDDDVYAAVTELLARLGGDYESWDDYCDWAKIRTDLLNDELMQIGMKAHEFEKIIRCEHKISREFQENILRLLVESIMISHNCDGVIHGDIVKLLPSMRMGPCELLVSLYKFFGPELTEEQREVIADLIIRAVHRCDWWQREMDPLACWKMLNEVAEEFVFECGKVRCLRNCLLEDMKKIVTMSQAMASDEFQDPCLQMWLAASHNGPWTNFATPTDLERTREAVKKRNSEMQIMIREQWDKYNKEVKESGKDCHNSDNDDEDNDGPDADKDDE